MIDIKGITKSFGSLQVLKGIDLHIDKGEVVSIVGPSGAGKTTLLQIIGTLDKPDSGSIEVDGIDVRSLSTKKLSDFRNQHLGFVFQFHQLLPEFTALENIMIPAFIAGKSRKEAPFEPTDKRTSFISSGQSITVTTQNKTPYLGFLNEVAKRKSFTLNSLLSSACHFSFSLPTFTTAPSLGTVSICLGKYCVWNISFR